MGPQRIERVKSQLLHEVAVIVKEELKDPRVGFATVTGVDLSPDCRHAKVFVSSLGSAAEQEESFKALVRAQGFVRAKVGERIRLRFTPEIVFARDESAAYADHIARIMESIKHAGQ